MERSVRAQVLVRLDPDQAWSPRLRTQRCVLAVVVQLVGDDRRGDESGGDAGRGPADAENGVPATRAGVVHGVVALRGVVVALPAVALRFTGFLVHAAGLAVAPDAGA